MRKSILFFGLTIFIFSCKKTNTPTSGNTAQHETDTSKYVSSFKQFLNKFLVEDSLEYDASHRLTAILMYQYDTTSGSPKIDSFKIAYSFTGNDTVPNSYVFYYPPNFQPAVHNLFYDNQNREIEDSATDDTASTIHISYPGNAMVLTWLGNPYNQNTYHQFDTLVLTDGNVTWYADYTYDPDNLFSSDLSAYSSYANPVYSATIANTIGGWINVWINSNIGDEKAFTRNVLNLTYLDFVSQNLPASDQQFCCETPGGPIENFNWVTDSRGRVVKGTLLLSGNTITILYSYY